MPGTPHPTPYSLGLGVQLPGYGAIPSVIIPTPPTPPPHHCPNTPQADGALQQICESVIVPNLRVRPEDEEMFEMNPTEYIRRDAEGGDSDTR